MSRYRKSIGSNALNRLSDFLNSNQKKALTRLKKLETIKGLKVLTSKEPHETWPFIVLILPNQKIRDQIILALWSKSLGVGRLFIKEISNYDYLKPYFKKTNVPAGKQFAENTMIISNSPWLTDKHFNEIYRVLNLHLK